MQIVIDIDDEMYKDANILIVKDLPDLKKIIAEGTPLPEGHGRLIDADSLIKAIEEKAKRLSNADTINGLCGAVALIYDEQAIIEADKEDE